MTDSLFLRQVVSGRIPMRNRGGASRLFCRPQGCCSYNSDYNRRRELLEILSNGCFERARPDPLRLRQVAAGPPRKPEEASFEPLDLVRLQDHRAACDSANSEIPGEAFGMCDEPQAESTCSHVISGSPGSTNPTKTPRPLCWAGRCSP